MLVFCPCSEPVDFRTVTDPLKLQLDSYPHTITDQNTHHFLSYLNFCEYCQSVKCRKCIEPEVITKYCPKCMQEMKPEYSFCSRNCFDCPKCDGNVTIHQQTRLKSYKLKCSSCLWNWETGELEKPRALARIVKNIINRENLEMQRFSTLETFYLQKKQLLQGNYQISKPLAIQMLNLNLKNDHQKDVENFINRHAIMKFNRELDIEQSTKLSQFSNNNEILNYNQRNKSIIPNRFDSQPPPNSTKLRIKTSKRCKGCRNSLMKPDKDPSSSKFYKLSNAIDYLPNLKIHPHPHSSSTLLKFLLSFTNPLDIPLKITISSFSTIPGFPNRKIHLPHNEFELGPKPGNVSKIEGFVKTIPTVELTRETNIGRIELMNRSIINFEYDVVEKGINWCVFPLSVEIDHPITELQIPVFITVKANYYSSGYWAILKPKIVMV